MQACGHKHLSFFMSKNCNGLTVLESLVVMAVCLILLWVVVPVSLVRLGYQKAGVMVVTDGDKAPEYIGQALDPDVLKPRVTEVQRPRVLPDSQTVPSPPVPPKQNPLKQQNLQRQ